MGMSTLQVFEETRRLIWVYKVSMKRAMRAAAGLDEAFARAYALQMLAREELVEWVEG